MIDLYYWTTANGHKITMFLEETGLEYQIKPVNIGKGDQFQPEFLKIAPNNKMPAIVDHEPAGGGAPISVFESGAILLYLAEKTGKLISPDLRKRVATQQWLFWQMGGLGPMLGQNHHFKFHASEKVPYGIKRYDAEARRLYAVLNKQLGENDYLAGEYSIADIACYPWIVPHEMHEISLDGLPHLKRWFNAIKERPATIRAFARAQEVNPDAKPLSDEEKKVLFGQGAEVVKG